MLFSDPAVLRQQSSPSNPASGESALFVNTSDVVTLRSAAGVEQSVGGDAQGPFLLGPTTSSLTNSTVTLADMTGLGATLLANSKYRFKWQGSWQTATNGVALHLELDAQGSLAVSVIRGTFFMTWALTTPWASVFTAINQDRSPDAATSTADTYIWRIWGKIETGVTGGTLMPRFRSETAGTTITIPQRAHGTLWKVG